jgi:hypothetical protein
MQLSLLYLMAWTNFSKRNKTWAEFSTLKVAVYIPCSNIALKNNCPNFKLKNQPKQLFGYLPFDIALPVMENHNHQVCFIKTHFWDKICFVPSSWYLRTMCCSLSGGQHVLGGRPAEDQLVGCHLKTSKQRAGPNVTKLFTVVIYECSK